MSANPRRRPRTVDIVSTSADSQNGNLPLSLESARNYALNFSNSSSEGRQHLALQILKKNFSNVMDNSSYSRMSSVLSETNKELPNLRPKSSPAHYSSDQQSPAKILTDERRIRRKSNLSTQQSQNHDSNSSIEVILPRKESSSSEVSRKPSEESPSLEIPQTKNADGNQNQLQVNIKDHGSQRAKTAPPQLAPCNTAGCLKKTPGRQTLVQQSVSTHSSRHSVSFAPNTLNVHRENKPGKVKSWKINRRIKFAHPCVGHFIPPKSEVTSWNGSEYTGNTYTKFYSVWCSPDARTSEESVTKQAIRFQRFRKLLTELATAHRSYNGVTEKQQTKVMLKEILPRYIMALDIALIDGEIDHAEQLLKTIGSSIRVLQITLHDLFFDSKGQPTPLLQVPEENINFVYKITPLFMVLNRLDNNTQGVGETPIESLLIKLQLEILVLTISPINCSMFRSLLSVVPSTTRRAIATINQLRKRGTNYIVKWVNDSVSHRDYMSILKGYGLCDEIGAKDTVPKELTLTDKSLDTNKFSLSVNSDTNQEAAPPKPKPYGSSRVLVNKKPRKSIGINTHVAQTAKVL